MARHHPAAGQMFLPGVPALEIDGKTISMPGNRIPHSEILKALQKSTGGGKSIEEIYRAEVLPVKTRTIQLLGRKCSVRIIHTLLGFEVQASYKRIHCPDMVTARYLLLFSQLGCHSIRLPYDPTVTARIIPDLEAAFERLSAGAGQLFARDRATRNYVLRRFCSLIRKRLKHE